MLDNANYASEHNGSPGRGEGGGGRSPPVPFFSPNLSGPQITCKWTMHTDKLTTKCHLCAYLPAGWLYVQDLGLASHDCEGSQR